MKNGPSALHLAPGGDVWYEMPNGQNMSIDKTQTEERFSNLRSYQSAGPVAGANPSTEYIPLAAQPNVAMFPSRSWEAESKLRC